MNELQIELQDAAYVGFTAQQAFDRLHEQAVIATDSTAYTWAGLSDKLHFKHKIHLKVVL